MRKHYIKLRLNDIFLSREYQFVFLAIIMIINLEYVLKILGNINKYQNFTIDYFMLYFTQNTGNKLSLYFFHFLVSILSVTATSIIFLKDKKMGIKNRILVILGNKNYYFLNLVVVFITTFILVFVPLFINFLTTCLTINCNEYVNLGRGIFDGSIEKYRMIFANEYLKSPLLLNIIYTFIPSMMMSLWACFIYSLSLFLMSIKMYFLPGISCLLFMIPQILLELLGKVKYRLPSYLYPIHGLTMDLSLNYLILICIFLIAISVLFISIKILLLKDEL